MKNKLLSLLLSVLLLISGVPAINVNAEKSSIDVDTSKGYVVNKVVDGDTIKIHKDDDIVTVRLLQIDTPESKSNQSFKNVPMGNTATEYTSNFLENKIVFLEYDIEKLDKYGRLLAYVYIKDDKGDLICLNEDLVKNGLAKTVKYGKNTKRYQQYLDIERSIMGQKTK